MAIKNTNIFNCKSIQNLPKLGFFCLKINIWQSGCQAKECRSLVAIIVGVWGVLAWRASKKCFDCISLEGFLFDSNGKNMKVIVCIEILDQGFELVILNRYSIFVYCVSFAIENFIKFFFKKKEVARGGERTLVL
jgi:hypothetical protein